MITSRFLNGDYDTEGLLYTFYRIKRLVRIPWLFYDIKFLSDEIWVRLSDISRSQVSYFLGYASFALIYQPLTLELYSSPLSLYIIMKGNTDTNG